MGTLVFYHLEGQSRVMCRLGIFHHVSNLCCKYIGLEEGHLSLILIQGAYLEALVREGTSDMAKFSAIQLLPFYDFLLLFLGINILQLVLRSMEPGFVLIIVEVTLVAGCGHGVVLEL
jgi:hypothetical protein